jgi:hypothetical protein
MKISRQIRIIVYRSTCYLFHGYEGVYKESSAASHLFLRSCLAIHLAILSLVSFYNRTPHWKLLRRYPPVTSTSHS